MRSSFELRQECLRRKAAADPDPGETERRIHRERRVRTHTDAEGAWNLSARGTTLAGARIGKALDLITDKLFRQARGGERIDSRDNLAFDAFDTMAGWFWDAYHGAEPDFDLGGSDSDADAAGEAGRSSSTDCATSEADDSRSAGGAASGAGVSSKSGGARGANRAERRRREDRSRKKPRAKVSDLVLVHVDWSALLRGRLLGDERCVMPGVGPLSVGAARDLLPEAVVKLVLTDGATVTNVTHLGSGVRFVDLVPMALKPRRQRGSSSAPRYLVLLRVDVGGGDAGDGMLASWTDDRIAGHGVDLASLSYTGRGLNAAQRMALLWSQPLCSVEGCNRYRVEYDHRTPWATVHETHVGNIDPLCGQHHRLKTTKGWALVEGSGKRSFVPPTDPRHPHARRRSQSSAAA